MIWRQEWTQSKNGWIHWKTKKSIIIWTIDVYKRQTRNRIVSSVISEIRPMIQLIFIFTAILSGMTGINGGEMMINAHLTSVSYTHLPKMKKFV